MVKRELKINLKSFIIWLSILIIMFLSVYLVYPFIITDDTVKNLDEMMKAFPSDLLKSFNMDITSISTAYGWLKSEGFMYVLIIVGIYSSNLGFNILLKEEYDKTIEYLSFLPIKRSKILTNKIVVGLSYIFAMVIILGLFNYICLCISGDFNHKQFLLLSITPIFVALPLFSLNMFISTLLHKTKKSLGLSIGLVFIFYIFNIISELSNKVSFIKYFSIYTLADIRNVIQSVRINPLYIFISIMLFIIFTIGSYVTYNRKELV